MSDLGLERLERARQQVAESYQAEQTATDALTRVMRASGIQTIERAPGELVERWITAMEAYARAPRTLVRASAEARRDV